MGVGKNLWLAGATAVQHLSDDPIVLALQISRRFPARIVQAVAAALCRIKPNSAALPFVIASCVAGDEAGLDRRFRAAAGAAGEKARLLADVALAAGRTKQADSFIAAAVGAKKLPATIARRKWYDGDMSGAVHALDGLPGSMRRQRNRLEGERRVFSEWTIRLPQTDFVPVEKRVLHLLTNSLPHTGSGYAQRSHSILQAQQDVGLEVLAVTRLGYPVQIGKVLAREADVIHGVSYRRMIPSSLAATADLRLQQEAAQLLAIALEFRPSILHTTSHFVNGLVVSAVAEALGIPWVYEVRGQLADTWASSRGAKAKQSERYRNFMARETQVMMDADLVVTLGESMKAGILGVGVSADKVMLAPNSVGGEYLREPRAPAAVRRQLGLEADGEYIGTVSSIVHYEGLDFLVDAFAMLTPAHPKLRLLIVGDGASLPALKRRAVELGIGQKTVFTGRVPREKAHLYHQAIDVFVVPRRDLDVTRVVTPLKPVEALASGRPVVASDLQALREIVSDGYNGKLFRAGNIEDLVGAIQKLIENSPLRTKYGHEGRKRILRERTWRVGAENYLAAYGKLTGHGK